MRKQTLNQAADYRLKKVHLNVIYFRIAILFASLLIGLLIGEAIIRILSVHKIITLDHSIRTDTRIFSPTRNYTHKPFSNRTNLIGDIKTSWFINRLGFRDGDYSFNKPENTVRVVVLGDSLTFGLGVESHESYPKILEVELNKNSNLDKIYEVLNMGLLGYGAIEYKNTYLEKGRQFKPDVVVVGFFLGNDSLDALWFDINKKAIFLKSIPDQLISYSLNEFLKSNSYLWVFLLQKYYGWVEKNISLDNIQLVFKGDIKGRMLRDVQIDPSNEYMKKSWDLTEEALNELIDYAKKEKTKTAILLIPTKEQIIPNEWEKAKSGGHNVTEKLYSDSAPRRIMLELCTKNKWECLDLQNPLREQINLESLFVKDDFHLSRHGNEVVTQLLFDYLLKNNLIEYQKR